MTELDDIDGVDDVIDDDDEETYLPEFEVSCEPMKRGANFRTMKLTFPRPDLAVVSRTLGMILFSGAFMVVGAAAAVMGVVACMGELTSANMILPPIFALGFGGAGYWAWRSCRPMTFDRIAGVFRRGGRKLDSNGRETGVPIDKIDSLQILSRCISGSDGGYQSHELNLVLNDPPGERINVMCHGNSDCFGDDAFGLAEFLDKPIWDPEVEL